jgi:hypothetical protein
MKLTIESTTRVVEINGVPARIWEGTSEAGVRVLCLVTRVAVERSQDCSQFDRELSEQRAPSAAALEIPSRLLL